MIGIGGAGYGNCDIHNSGHHILSRLYRELMIYRVLPRNPVLYDPVPVCCGDLDSNCCAMLSSPHYIPSNHKHYIYRSYE